MLKKIIKPETMERAKAVIQAHIGVEPVMTGRHFAWVEDGKLKAVIGLKRKSWFVTEICHFVVLPGYPHAVLQDAIRAVIEQVKTPTVMVAIPTRDHTTMSAFMDCGFITTAFGYRGHSPDDLLHAFNNAEGKDFHLLTLAV